MPKFTYPEKLAFCERHLANPQAHSIRDFCKEHDLATSSVYEWLRNHLKDPEYYKRPQYKPTGRPPSVTPEQRNFIIEYFRDQPPYTFEPKKLAFLLMKKYDLYITGSSMKNIIQRAGLTWMTPWNRKRQATKEAQHGS